MIIVMNDNGDDNYDSSFTEPCPLEERINQQNAQINF